MSIRDNVANGIVTGVGLFDAATKIGGGFVPPPSCAVDQTITPPAAVREFDAETCVPWFQDPAEQGLDVMGLRAEQEMDDLAERLSGPPPGMDGPFGLGGGEAAAPPLG